MARRSKKRPNPLFKAKQTPSVDTVQANKPKLPMPDITQGTRLICRAFKDGKTGIKFIYCGQSTVMAVYITRDQKYCYHITYQNYKKIERLDDDHFAMHGIGLSPRRFLILCKKYAISKDNEDILLV